MNTKPILDKVKSHRYIHNFEYPSIDYYNITNSLVCSETLIGIIAYTSWTRVDVFGVVWVNRWGTKL